MVLDLCFGGRKLGGISSKKTWLKHLSNEMAEGWLGVELLDHLWQQKSIP